MSYLKVNDERDPKSAMVDEKKMKRMIANRESARRARKRKKELMLNLSEQLAALHAAINVKEQQIKEISGNYTILATDNTILRAQKQELAERLKALDDLIQGTEFGVDDYSLQLNDDFELEPWQIPFNMQAIPASSNLYF